MAQCQINILSGTVLIRYNLAGTDNEIQADSGDPVWIDDSATDVTLDNTKIVTLSALTTSTDYYFRYRISGVVESGIGHFKTFPAVGTAEHLVFVTGSCQETANMKVFDVMPTHDDRNTGTNQNPPQRAENQVFKTFHTRKTFCWAAKEVLHRDTGDDIKKEVAQTQQNQIASTAFG